ncbi:hypothetical protein KFK09_008494 [Dendrobium nobile]|uniref:Protein kinase domain-containing protein n=1 Tax=Dendrobium nobile TaxID=94219 RepID=A0A8T3BPN2_DENNO|nr:hypothetical protein KFK09_008494 [Dendrobium nobile]
MSDSFDQDYRLGERLGRGQVGAVYKCVSISTGKDFAVKIIDKFSGCFDRGLVYSEIKLTLLAASENSRSVQIHQVYEDITAVYLIMDLCPGPDLFDRNASHGPFFESEAAALITELVEAVAECHRRGIAHRDIKPENILFDSNGRLLLADFGCAALFEKGARSLKGKVGTPAYAAPEVMAGETYDEKVDVWSAGIVLYFMLGWTLSFNGENVEEIVAAVKKGDPVRFPKEFFPWLSRGAEDLIAQMLARDPTVRLSAEQNIHGSRRCQWHGPSIARVLVELDVTKNYPYRVWVGPESSGYVQQVVLEDFPPFCSSYKKFGHPSGNCHLVTDISVKAKAPNMDSIIPDPLINEAAVLPLVEVTGTMQMDASLVNCNVNKDSVDYRVTVCENIPLVNLVSGGEVAAVSNTHIVEGVKSASHMLVSEVVVGGVLSAALDSRVCTSADGCVGCVANSSPCLGSAPSTLPGFVGSSVVLDTPVLSDRVVDSYDGLAFVGANSMDAFPVTPNDKVSRHFVEIPINLVSPKALVDHVSSNLGEPVRQQLDWLHCLSDSSSEASGEDEPPIMIASLKDRPVVSVASRGRVACGFWAMMWFGLIAGMSAFSPF